MASKTCKAWWGKLEFAVPQSTRAQRRIDIIVENVRVNLPVDYCTARYNRACPIDKTSTRPLKHLRCTTNLIYIYMRGGEEGEH